MQTHGDRASTAGLRRWLRFSLRGVLAAVTIVAIWLGYHVNLARTQSYATSQLKALDGVVEIYYDWQYDAQGNDREMSWWRRTIGDHLFSRVTGIWFCSDVIAEATSKDLDHLTIKDLAIDVSDSDVAILRRFPHLQQLYLHDTNITDAGLAHLRDLRSLEYLSLQRTRVTDAGLVHLQTLTNLKYLYIDQCPVTADGAAALRRALPNTVIFAEWETDPIASIKPLNVPSSDNH